jgi:protein PsiE
VIAVFAAPDRSARREGSAMTDRKSPARNLDQRMLSLVDPLGRLLTDSFHILALFAIGGATVWAAAAAFYAMVQKGSATIEDLLLLFIYLEIGSMVGIYFRTNHMPVRFLLYVGITALTRHLIGFVQHEEIADVGVLILASAILILAFAVLVIRFASSHFPAPTDGEVARGDVGRSEIHDE